jgi:predicted nucleic-acid-binding protein
MSSAYDLQREQIAEALGRLLRTNTLIVDRAGEVLKALRMFRLGSADFADCLIERISASAGCNKTMTFDIRAAKAVGMMLVQ